MSEQNGWHSTRSAARGRDPKLRAGDADREAVAGILRGQHAEGRLDTDEFQDRIDVCYHAKTLGELERLLSDLPREHRTAKRSAWRLTPWRIRLLALVPIVAALAAVSAVTGRPLIWLAIPLVLLTTRLAVSRCGPWSARTRGDQLGERWV